jgi:sulfide:quinone oxidoreductase
MFGDEASAQVAAALADRGVRLRTGVSPHRVGDGRLWLALERSEPADLAVALPRLAGPAVDGLPCDAEGFVAVDEVGRVHLVDDVYAVGDMADHPIKQGGLATQQADVAAAAVARWAGSPVPVGTYTPVLRALLLTGGEPLCLRNPPGPDDSPWWPPHKISGTYLPSYLATHGHFRLPVTT